MTANTEVNKKTTKPFYTRIWFIILMTVILLGTLGNALGGKTTTESNKLASSSSTSSSVNTSTETKLAGSYKVSDQIKTGDKTFTISNFKDNVSSGNEFIQPKSGNKFITLTMSITNNGKSKASISTLMGMYLKDSEGSKYNQTLMINTGKQLDGELLAGDTVKGDISYEVPIVATGLKFYYNPSWLGDETIIVTIN